MARMSSNNNNRSNTTTSMMQGMSNIQASCYLVGASSGSLKAFHYSTTGAGGTYNIFLPLRAFPSPSLPEMSMTEHSGVPEVGSGSSSSGSSPPLVTSLLQQNNSNNNNHEERGTTYTITEECERLFCDTLRVTFLGEGNVMSGESNVMGTNINNINNSNNNINTSTTATSNNNSNNFGTAKNLLAVQPPGSSTPAMIQDWLELWDYVGGSHLRGFIVDGGGGGRAGEKSLFVFFEPAVLSHNLKPALMALLELATHPDLNCSSLAICLDRSMTTEQVQGMVRDLAWVGFKPVTLDQWTSGGNKNVISSEWLFLAMEV
ncbi:MAG: Histidine biosynthesis bifunctional protein hisB [Watsoniomyces obsoletus]|nr:MAG: Histidine biosynthesis bifunctional protein hisB [Watsoniomyces obsoletus]